MVTPYPRGDSWESMLQDYDPAQIGIVDLEGAMELTNKDIVNQIIERREESRRAMASSLEWDWDYYEDMYYFTWRDPSKQSWQSDLNVPEVYDRVRRALAELQGALTESERFFEIEAIGKNGNDQLTRFIRDWLHYAAKESNLVPELLRMWEDALLLGTGCMKITLESVIDRRPRVAQRQLYQDPQMAFMAQLQGMPTSEDVIEATPRPMKKLACRHIPLRHCFPDPAVPRWEERGFFYEEGQVPRHIVEERVAAGMYDSAEDLGAPERMRDDFYGARHRELFDHRITSRKMDLVGEYTGDIYGKKGQLVAKNWIATLGNDKALLRLRANPTWSGESRYIWSTPIPYEGRIWGRSMVEVVAEYQEEMSSTLNLMIDDIRYSIIPSFVVDTTKAEGPIDVTSLEPGRMWEGRDASFVQKIQFPSQAMNVWPVLQQLERMGDKSSFVGEWSSGTPTARGRASATEANIKSGNSSSFMHSMATQIEENDVEPALNLLYEYIMQFWGETYDPALSDLMQEWGGPEMLQNDMFRFKLLDVPFRIRVRGISMVANREGTVDRLMQAITLMQQIGVPPADLIQPVYTLIASLGFRPDQFGFPPDAEQYIAWMQQMQAQGGAGGATGPSPMGGAPQQPSGSTAPPNSQSTALQTQASGPPIPG